MKLIALVAAGATIGGAVGASKILCPGGECMMTGSWFGGGTIGGLLAFAASGFFAGRIEAPEGEDLLADDSDDAAADADERRTD